MIRRHVLTAIGAGALVCLLAGGAAFAGVPAASPPAAEKAVTAAPLAVPAPAAKSPAPAAPATTPVSRAAQTTAAASARANAPVPETASPASAATAPEAAPAQATDDYYRPLVKADPFKPFLEMDQIRLKKKQDEQKLKAAAKGRPISPLQQAEIGQFRLIGIAGDDQKRTAVVEDRTTKRFYPLSVGTYIGPNEGRVAEILADRVVVVEPGATQNGKRKTKTKRIPLFLRSEP